MFVSIDHRQLQQDALCEQTQTDTLRRLQQQQAEVLQQQSLVPPQVQPVVPQVIERIIERQVPTLIPHDHPSELPAQGAPYGGVLTNTDKGLVWQPLRAHKDAYDRIDRLERHVLDLVRKLEVNNQEKRSALANLKTYWAEKHPDCFIELEDGRKVFHQELLDYKHDLLLTSVYNRKTVEPKLPKQWPLWLAFAGLFLMEIAHVVIH